MCLFITAVAPKSAMTPAFLDVVARHHFFLDPVDNPFVAKRLRPGEAYVSMTRGHCDCGSPLFTESATRTPAELERRIAKLRRKGWREGKIRSWVESTEPTSERANQGRDVGRALADWADFLDEARADPRAYVGLVGHWYKRGPANDELELGDRLIHRVEELRSKDFAGLAKDIVHEFRSPGSS